jgi:hypothetical protein
MIRKVRIIIIGLLITVLLGVGIVSTQQNDDDDDYIPIEISQEVDDADGDGQEDSTDEFVDEDDDGVDDRTGLTEEEIKDLLEDLGYETIDKPPKPGDFVFGDVLPFEDRFNDELMKDYAKRYENLKPSELIEMIRWGDPLVMRFVQFDVLDDAVDWLRDRGSLYFLNPEEYKFIDDVIVALMELERSEIKYQILKALASGVYNLDPRVRLVTFKLLRRIIPDTVMKILIYDAALNDAEKRLYQTLLNREGLTRHVLMAFKSETVGRPVSINLILDEGDGEVPVVDDEGNIIKYVSLGSMYVIRDLKGRRVAEYAYIELVKLASFIIRRELMADMKTNPEMMRTIKEELFYVLSKAIDGEDFHKIPTFSATPEYIKAYTMGMDNPNEYVALESGKALVRIMRKRSTPDEVRISIFDILRNSKFKYLILNPELPKEARRRETQDYFEDMSSKTGVNVFLKKNGMLPDSNFKWNDRYDYKREELIRIGRDYGIIGTDWIWYSIVPEVDWQRPIPFDEDQYDEGIIDNQGDFEELLDDTVTIIVPDVSEGGDITGEGLGEGSEDLDDREGIDGDESEEDEMGDTGDVFDDEWDTDDDEDGTFTLTTYVNPPGSGSVNPVGVRRTSETVFVYNEGETAEIEAIPNSGWAFDQWAGDINETDNPVSILMDSDKTIYALFGKDADGDGVVDNKYTLNIDVRPEGAGTVDYLKVPDNEYGEGVELTLTAIPETGYLFDNWEGDLTGPDNPAVLTMDSDKDITAVFEQEGDDGLWTLTININPDGSGTVQDPNVRRTEGGDTVVIKYNDGENATLDAIPNQGYAFDQWAGDLTGSDDPATLVMDSDKEVTAFFGEDTDGDGLVDNRYTLTVDVDPAGAGTVDYLQLPNNEYAVGVEIELTPEANAGYAFDYWDGDLSGSSTPDVVKMDSDKSVTAVFGPDEDGDGEVDKWSLTINVEPEGAGEVNVSIVNPDDTTRRQDVTDLEFRDGTEIRIHAVANQGFIFEEWEGDVTGSSTPVDIVMDSDKTVTAVFSPDESTINLDIFGESGDPLDFDNPSKIRFLNAVPDAPPLELVVEGDGSGGINYQTRTQWGVFEADTRLIEVRLAGTGTPIAESFQLEMEALKEYTIIALGMLSGTAGGEVDSTIDILVMEDDILNLSIPENQDKTEFRVLHTVPVDVGIDVELVKSDGTISRPSDLQGITYKEFSDYVEIEDGLYSINLYVEGTNQIITALPSQSFGDGKRYMLVAFPPSGTPDEVNTSDSDDDLDDIMFIMVSY